MAVTSPLLMGWFRRDDVSTVPFGVPQEVVIADTCVEMTFRRSQRAKRLRLRVAEGKLEVVVPLRVSRAEAWRLVREHEEWIVKHVQSHLDQLPPDDQGVFFCGERHGLRFVEGARRGVFVSDGVISVFGADPGEQLRKWLQRQAAQAVNDALDTYTAQMGLHPVKVSLRDQKTKWGACTSRGTLTFNWRLVMAPPEVLEYVVIHELAHLQELNHSARFWAIVEAHCPGHKVHKKWLRENGRLLKLPEGF